MVQMSCPPSADGRPSMRTCCDTLMQIYKKTVAAICNLMRLASPLPAPPSSIFAALHSDNRRGYSALRISTISRGVTTKWVLGKCLMLPVTRYAFAHAQERLQPLSANLRFRFQPYIERDSALTRNRFHKEIQGSTIAQSENSSHRLSKLRLSCSSGSIVSLIKALLPEEYDILRSGLPPL